MDEVDLYLYDLKTKFEKINPNQYYLSYSRRKRQPFFILVYKRVLTRRKNKNCSNKYLFRTSRNIKKDI